MVDISKYEIALIYLGLMFIAGLLSVFFNLNTAIILAPLNTFLLVLLARKDLMEFSK